MTRVDSRVCPPISYSHFHVPTGSAFLSCAPARPHSPSTSAADRIVFMVALAERRAGTVRRGPPPAAGDDCRDGVATGQMPALYNRRTFRGCHWFSRILVAERLPWPAA